MSTESRPAFLPFNRLLNLVSIGLLAVMIFGLARLGFGIVPVWILAVPFVLLASLDIESCFARTRTFSARLMPVAFHFVIIATVFAAHQQIGAAGTGMRDSGVMASKSGAWGCAAGGCGKPDSGGGCGGACGSSGGSAAGGAKSACGCGSGKATASSSRPIGSPSTTASKRSSANRISIPLPMDRAASPGIPGAADRPPGNAVGPKLGAGMHPPVGATNAPPATGSTPPAGIAPAAMPKAPVAVPAIAPNAPPPPLQGPTTKAPVLIHAPTDANRSLPGSTAPPPPAAKPDATAPGSVPPATAKPGESPPKAANEAKNESKPANQ